MIPETAVPVANHLWQSTLFVAAVWLITLALRKNRAAVRHSLWVAASIKFLIPFALLFSIGTLSHWPAVRASQVSAFAAIGQPFGDSSVSIPIGATSWWGATGWTILLYVWIFGFVASILWWAVQWLQLRRVVREATAVNMDVPIPTRVHGGQLEPGVVGIFRPVLLLPEGIADHLSPAQLQAVLAHELCHVRRRDNFTAAIHMIVEALFWFHPVVWWMRLRLIDEQERACDEEVLRLGGDPQVYAESILKVCESYLTSRSMCVSGITSSNLRKRIGDIMRNHRALRLSFSKALLLAVAAIAAVAAPIMMGMAGVQAEVQPGPAVAVISPPVGVEVGQATQTAVALPAAQRGVRETATPPGVNEDYLLGEITISGVKVFTEDIVQSVLGLVPGQRFNEFQLRKGFEDLKNLYGNRGYVNFLPQPVVDFDEQQKVVSLKINIDEGGAYLVNRIGFTGNTTTPAEVLRRE